MTQNEDQWRPGERPDQPPTAPYDSDDPDPRATNPLPIPPNSEQPPAPVREPDQPDPIRDPQPPQPRRLA